MKSEMKRLCDIKSLRQLRSVQHENEAVEKVTLRCKAADAAGADGRFTGE